MPHQLPPDPNSWARIASPGRHVDVSSVPNVGLGTGTNDQLPTWAVSCRDCSTWRNRKPDGESVHTHNFKNVISPKWNSIITWFSPIIKIIHASIMSYIQKKSKRVLKNTVTLVNIFVKSYACCLPTYSALNNVFGSFSMSFPLCGMLSCLLFYPPFPPLRS